MIRMHLSEAARVMNGVLTGVDREFTGCSIDSRTTVEGELFVAVRGENFDGHSFIDSAVDNGASAALVEHSDIEATVPLVRVNSTRLQLGRLAGHWRNMFGIPVIAVTGSNGKTTVKEMISAILSVNADVLATRGNLNNDLGVPLTLFRIGAEHDYAVIEMGANHPGEISQLCDIARPTIALITLCAPAHLQGFGSIEGVARAKAEIFEGLGREDTAILNLDDEFHEFWKGCTEHTGQLSFGLNPAADINARDIKHDHNNDSSSFVLVTDAGETPVSIPLPGKHNVMNALAAAACCRALRVSLQDIRLGLEHMQPVRGRMQVVRGRNNTRIFDDTYNANPASLAAAMSTVCTYPGEHWLVLGDMGELGEQSAEFHREAGLLARQLGFTRLFATGKLSGHSVQAFGEGGELFADKNELTDFLKNISLHDLNILVKGSRAMAMEAVVAALSEVV